MVSCLRHSLGTSQKGSPLTGAKQRREFLLQGGPKLFSCIALIKKHKYYKKEHIRQKIRLMLNSLENNVADLNSNLNLGSESFSRWWFDI